MRIRLWLILALLVPTGCAQSVQVVRVAHTATATRGPTAPIVRPVPAEVLPPPPIAVTEEASPTPVPAIAVPRRVGPRLSAPVVAPLATAAPSPSPPDGRYCPALDRPAPPAECVQASDPDRFSTEGRASLSRPRRMYRGQIARVRFAVVQGSDQRVADAAARTGSTGDTTDAVGRVRYGRRMEARLTGQGFEITPITPAKIDTGGIGEAAWEWRIRPTRSDAHYLQVEAWTLTSDGRRGPPIRYPTYAVAVPVRWWPDRVGDLTSDSIGWFGQGTSWLKALAALLTAAAAVWAAWKKLRPAKPQGSATAAP